MKKTLTTFPSETENTELEFQPEACWNILELSQERFNRIDSSIDPQLLSYVKKIMKDTEACTFPADDLFEPVADMVTSLLTSYHAPDDRVALEGLVNNASYKRKWGFHDDSPPIAIIPDSEIRGMIDMCQAMLEFRLWPMSEGE